MICVGLPEPADEADIALNGEDRWDAVIVAEKRRHGGHEATDRERCDGSAREWDKERHGQVDQVVIQESCGGADGIEE